jgi:NitT/TauT family transport system ATP-binding protein
MLEVDHVSMTYRRGGKNASLTRALHDVSLSAKAGEFITIIGPSGCGKTTLLYCMAGLNPGYEGGITVDGEPVAGPAAGRSIVFQAACLLPWRTVTRNVGYSLELLRGQTKAEAAARVQAAIDLVGLSGFESYYPAQLSGGMQQRVNLARALATRPRLLLMDEPFASLDALTKELLQGELLRIMRDEECTTVFITHDIEEAVLLGDRVIVMSPRPGRIAGEYQVPFPRPRDRDIAESPEFSEVVRQLRAVMREEIERAPEAEPTSAAAGGRA